MKIVNVFIDFKKINFNHYFCKSIVGKVCKHYNYDSYDINIIFTSDTYLSALKKEFFSKNQWTDVIAFPMQNKNSKHIEGEIYISIPTAKKNSIAFNEPYEKELTRLIIHGSLHLLGIEDRSTDQKEEMIKLEETFLKDISWSGLIEK